MARRFTTSPRNLLTFTKISVRRTGFKTAKVPEPLIAGLNEPETKVANALTELKIKFEMQKNMFGGSILGGARLDFFLPDYSVDLEYNGPFHGTTEGRARDVLRTSQLLRDGIRLVAINEYDLPRIKPVILQKIGVPLTRTPVLEAMT